MTQDSCEAKMNRDNKSVNCNDKLDLEVSGWLE